MKKTLSTLIITTCLSVLLLTPQVISAEETSSLQENTATKSTKKTKPKVTPEIELAAASPSAEQTNQNLKDRIDRVIEQRKEEVKGVVDQIGNKKRGILGEVQRVTEKTITIKNKKASHTFTITSDIILAKENTKISLDDIAVGDWVMAMGYVQGEEFDLRRLVVTGKSLAPKPTEISIGSVKSITKTQLVLRLRKNTQQEVSVAITKDSKFQNDNGSEMKREDVKPDYQFLVISTGEGDKKDLVLAHSLAPIQVKDAR